MGYTVLNPAAATASALQGLFAHHELQATRASVSAGTVLHEPHSTADAVYYLHRGQVRTYQVGPDGSSRLLEILGPDEWTGAASLAQFGTHNTRAVAVAPSVVTRIPATRLLELLPRHPEAALELIRSLGAKLQAAREDSARLVFDNCNQRLVKTLIRFSSSAAATVQEDGIVLRITHQQLAQAVGVARETVSLALTQLRQQNLLRTGRNQLFFKPETLQDFIARKLHQVEQITS